MNTSLYICFNKNREFEHIFSALSKVNGSIKAQENIDEDEDGVCICTLDSAITGQESLYSIKKYADQLKNILSAPQDLRLEFHVLEEIPHPRTRLHLDCDHLLSSLSSCYAGIQYIAFPYPHMKSSRRQLTSFFLIHLSLRGQEVISKTWKDIAQQGLSHEEGIEYVHYHDHHFILLYGDIMNSYNHFIAAWLENKSEKYALEDYALFHLSYFMPAVYTEVTLSAKSLQLLYNAHISVNIDIHKSFFVGIDDESPRAQVVRYLFSSKKMRKLLKA